MCKSQHVDNFTVLLFWQKMRAPTGALSAVERVKGELQASPVRGEVLS